MDYRTRLAQVIEGLIGQTSKNISGAIKEANKNIDADWAINCFALKPFLKKNGPEIALLLKEKFTSDYLLKHTFIESVQVAGPYLNFKINKIVMAKDLTVQIFKDIDTFAKSSHKEPLKRIIIEYPSPNTNKPLHLGHVRNMLLGQALSVLNEYVGNSIFQCNLENDRGVHICKSMWAYYKWGENKTPITENIKSDHFVGKYYVLYSQEEAKFKEIIKKQIENLEIETQKMKIDRDEEKIQDLENFIENSDYGILQKKIKQMLFDWENKNQEVRKLWRQMNDWAEQGFNETFKIFNIEHDKTYLESEIYDKGKEIVLKGVEKGIFERLEDGAVITKFKKKNLPKEKVLLRKDGTALYITQDIYLAYKKMEDFNYDLSIYVVGNEQDMQLRTVFEILKNLGMKGENFHYSHGMINLTTGKMKSREGTTVDADFLVEDVFKIAYKEVLKRYKDLNKEELEKRSRLISMGAIRFFILKYEYTKDFTFDPEISISFEGETGPYIMYVYARICSIYKKGMESGIDVPFNPIENKINEKFNVENVDFSLYQNEHEINLIDLIYKYPDIILESAKNLKPHVLARYLLALSQEYNGFYHSCQILKEKENIRYARLVLSENIRRILKHGLDLLTIEVLNEM
ncbi:MAG: arginine--tRNA ligase [archaeon]|nr:arginine--tRNA ligase [archaeon]